MDNILCYSVFDLFPMPNSLSLSRSVSSIHLLVSPFDFIIFLYLRSCICTHTYTHRHTYVQRRANLKIRANDKISTKIKSNEKLRTHRRHLKQQINSGKRELQEITKVTVRVCGI